MQEKDKAPRELSKKELEAKLDEYGRLAKTWNRKFAGLLPEVRERKLHEELNCSSISELAAKKGGLSWQQVQRVLKTSEALKDKPQLSDLLQRGEVSSGKVALVASLATKESDSLWAKKVKELSWKALKELVSRSKKESEMTLEEEEARAMGYSPKRQSYDPSDRMVDLPFEATAAERFLTFKEDYSVSERKNLSSSNVLNKLLDGYGKGKGAPPKYGRVVYADPERELFLTPTRWGLMSIPKEEISSKAKESGIEDLDHLLARAKEACKNCKSRNLPRAAKVYITARFGGFCAYPGCNKRARIFHHLDRWALVKEHDPERVLPLCKAHEELAHSGLIENELESLLKWKVRLQREVKSKKAAEIARIDSKQKDYRRK